MIDLRSDTVTVPCQAMLDAMASAKVGDDVFKEDPTVNALQESVADLFGMEAALFFPSGTMANQAAIKVHTRSGDELICDANAHVHFYEGGGIASNSGVSVNAIEGVRGVFAAQDVAVRIRPENVHFPSTSLVCLENTCNRGGGRVFPIANVQAIAETCRENGLKLHLDGARIFNAMLAEGSTPLQHGALYDSISICLSKGLGAPIGSLLLGKSEFISRALRVRKVFGGGMRQAGFIAAAGLFALENNLARLSEDHYHASLLAECLAQLSYVNSVFPQETNIVIFQLNADIDTLDFLKHLERHGIRAITMGDQMVRFVTHLNVSLPDIQMTIQVLKQYGS